MRKRVPVSASRFWRSLFGVNAVAKPSVIRVVEKTVCAARNAAKLGVPGAAEPFWLQATAFVCDEYRPVATAPMFTVGLFNGSTDGAPTEIIAVMYGVDELYWLALPRSPEMRMRIEPVDDNCSSTPLNVTEFTPMSTPGTPEGVSPDPLSVDRTASVTFCELIRFVTFTLRNRVRLIGIFPSAGPPEQSSSTSPSR